MKLSNPIQVLLLVGNERRFLDTMKLFEKYVLNEVRVPKENVHRLLCAYLTTNKLLQKISGVVERAKQENSTVVLYYYGHGFKGGFSPTGDSIDYNLLAKMLVGVQFLFINASCHAGSAIRTMKHSRLLPRHGSVIAITPADTRTDKGESFLCDILDSFRRRKPFLKRVVRMMITGKEILDFSDHVESTDDGIERIDSLDWKTTKITYRRPRPGPVMYTPLRSGKQLDHLLYPWHWERD